MTISAYDVLEILWQSAGLCQSIPKSFLRLTGDPTSSLPSSFNLGVAAQASIAAAGLAAAHMRALSTSEEMQMQVTVDARHAALEFHSEAYYTLNGAVPGGIWDDIAGTYPTKDSFVRIHTNFPHHREGILSILGLSSGVSRETVAQAIAKWNSRQFEEEAANRGMCATAMRSFDEWDEHPHALAIRDTPPVQLIKLSDAPPRNPFSAAHGKGALDGVRVLDLTRVIAGPVCGRTLAAYGADVLLVTSPNLPSLPNLDADTSRGKRTTQLDLTTIAGRDNLRSLIRDADVFLQAYRPGGLAEKGFGPTDLARIKPGIVCANLTAWGWEGPWKKRRGFDSLVQTATGFNVAEAQAFASYQGEADGIVTPKPFPVQALDHAAGYLLAFGIAAALCKTITVSALYTPSPFACDGHRCCRKVAPGKFAYR
ncbi:CoA-transferase family III [Ramaria rubella]|nr:CoA-transferase family III [Ramaria rubella]